MAKERGQSPARHGRIEWPTARLIATASHQGNASRFMYDSRGNLVQSSDGMGATNGLDLRSLRTKDEHEPFDQFTAVTLPAPTPTINSRGNTIKLTYDGVNRPLTTTVDLRDDGTGGGTISGGITTSQIWDGNSRVGARTDPKNNTTAYAFDDQNRPVSTLFADGTQKVTAWNRNNTIANEVDPRGVAYEYTYDAIERRTQKDVSNLPQGQGQTSFVAWRWDGLSRMSRAEDNDSICEYSWDSLSRQVSDKQRIGTGVTRTSPTGALDGEVFGTLTRGFDGVGNLIKCQYPSGHTFDRRYDDIDRLSSVTDVTGGMSVASFSHIGMGSRRLGRTYSLPQVTQSFQYDANRRVTRLDQRRATDNQRVAGFTYAWDRAHNRKFERHLLRNTVAAESQGTGSFYEYDSAYRLTHADKDVASFDLDNVMNNKATVTKPPVDPAKARDWNLDDAGNRTQTTVETSISSYFLQSGKPTFDSVMNQYTGIGSKVRTHDAAGNVTSSDELGQQSFFDCDNRLVQWTDTTPKDIRYRYDAGGRRIMKEDREGSFATVLYFYDGWQNVEETDSSGVLKKRYVYGEGIDEVLRATLPDAADIDGDLDTAEQVDLYYHQNSIGSVVAVTDSAGDAVERYEYAPYGEVEIQDGAGNPISATAVEQPFMFTGRRLDFEEGSGLYYYRNRYYDPVSGRFISRDPLGVWGDPAQRGNAQNYCGNDPINCVDPLGFGVFEDMSELEQWWQRAQKGIRESCLSPEEKARQLRRQEKKYRKKIKDISRRYRRGDDDASGPSVHDPPDGNPTDPMYWDSLHPDTPVILDPDVFDPHLDGLFDDEENSEDSPGEESETDKAKEGKGKEENTGGGGADDRPQEKPKSRSKTGKRRIGGTRQKAKQPSTGNAPKGKGNASQPGGRRGNPYTGTGRAGRGGRGAPSTGGRAGSLGGSGGGRASGGLSPSAAGVQGGILGPRAREYNQL